jgi:hypothetical protein
MIALVARKRSSRLFFYAHSLLLKRRTEIKSNLLFFFEQSHSLSRIYFEHVFRFMSVDLHGMMRAAGRADGNGTRCEPMTGV